MSDHTNPWRTKSTRVAYENPWIRVDHREVITPSDTDGIYGVVHFKNVAIGIIPVDPEGYTWLVGQYRYTLDLYSWEIPMGGGPLGIGTQLSAQRELQEETGITAAQWTELTRLHTSNSVTDESAIVYLATGLSHGPTAHEETEDITIKKLRISEAIDMALTGEITDAISVCGLLQYRLKYMSQ